MLEYNVFGLCLDSEERCWIHDGQSNQIVCLDKQLKEKAVYDGISFNRMMYLKIECGFGSTEAVFKIPNKDKLYWHKGKGILSCLLLNEDKEIEFADTITGSFTSRTRLNICSKNISRF